MKVLILGDPQERLSEEFKARDIHFQRTEEKITLEYLSNAAPDYMVSYNYKHILKSDILEFNSCLKFPAINLHISYLPWNRGADPNPWSYLEGSQPGVTIHLIDEGVDTGDIVVQRKVEIKDSESLASSYEILQVNILEMFWENWENITAGKIKPVRQTGNCSYHSLKDRALFLGCLENKSWDTPIKDFKRNYLNKVKLNQN